MMQARTVMVSACSAEYFCDWLDLLDSIEALGLRQAFDCALIDLGLTPEQRAYVAARGVRCAKGEWMFAPPAGLDALHHLGFGAKPFLPRYFPGYELYLWMDADTWAQTAEFWPRLRDGALREGASFPYEVDADYARVTPALYRWMAGNTYLGTRRLSTALRVACAPLTNHGIFAMRADSPLWTEWQETMAEMVARAQKIVAFDQLALAVMLFERKRPWDGPDATHNWNCQRALPVWDEARKLWVSPRSPHRVIHALHLTNFTRARLMSLQTVAGGTWQGTTHRPGGYMERVTRDAARQAA